jgi:hypothetical protein
MAARFRTKTFVGLGIALAAGALLCAGALRSGFQGFAEGYFLGALLALSIPVGALGVRLVHALTGGRWGGPVLPYCVSASRMLPLALVLWVPVLLWLSRLYPWARPDVLAADPVLAHRALYMNVPFFAARSVAYFAVWIFAAWRLDRQGARADLSGLLAVLYFLAGTFAAMDWVMSLSPHWYSTVFGATFVTGQVLLAFCFAVLLAGTGGRPAHEGAPPGVFVDEGSLILTMVLFWAYLAFAQFLIIWMGDMPHEISWYLGRVRGGWSALGPVIIAGHLFLPLFLLLRRSWKAQPAFLAAVALLVILMRAGDVAWMVFGALGRPPGALSAAHAGSFVAVVSLYLLGWFWHARRSGGNL